MPTKEQFMQQKQRLKMMVSGHFGSGKSHLGFTFPKVYAVVTEPQDLGILHDPANADLLANLVEYDLCYVDGSEGRFDWQQLVEEPTGICPLPPLAGQTKEGGLLYRSLRKAHQAAKEGRIETLFLDNLTYTAEAFFQYLEKYRANQFVTDKGAVEKRQMYGYLSNWLYRFLMTSVVNFPGNVVVSCHLKSESEEKMKKKKDGQVEVVPNILGGFRDKAEGLFTASIYLERKLLTITDPETKKVRQEPRFVAYTQNQIALGSKILAKNVHGLPAVMHNMSYQSIMAHIGREVAREVVA